MTVMACPACTWTKSQTVNGPVYKPPRWYRRQPYWHCTWCRYEWVEDDSQAEKELFWWRQEFICRLTPDSDYYPKPGEALYARQFRLVEVTPHG